MKHASWLVSILLALLTTASDAWAKPTRIAGRKLAEAPAPVKPQRVVVTEGDAKTARLVNELEQELKASSYVIVRVPMFALEPEAMLQTLREARATRGIVLFEDGKSVMVLAASRGGTTLRVYGEYSLNHDNRLARRRQWISLVERLRVPTDDEANAKDETPWGEETAPTESPVPATTALAPLPAETDGAELPDRRSNRLGATMAFGYVSGRTGLVSHLMLVGNRSLAPGMNLIAYGLWPVVPGDRISDDRMHTRVWTFAGNVGLAGDLGRPSWWVNPYLGITVGVQFLLAYVDKPADAITDTYKVASLTLDLHAGVRFSLRRGTWLLVQASGGRVSSLATRPGGMTDSLADTWALRSALGLLMAL
jgi:hypothetical protein